MGMCCIKMRGLKKPTIKVNEDLPEITREDILKATGSLVKGKHPGEEDTPAELLQTLDPAR